MCRVRRSAEAEEDLIKIWVYIAGNNPVAANDVLDFLDGQFKAIARNPKIGRVRSEFWPDGYCYNTGKGAWRSHYLIFYWIKNDCIEIARVLEGHQEITEDRFS